MPDPLLPLRKLRIGAIHTENSQTKTFFLETVDGHPLVYKAGQFVTFVFHRPDGTENRRSYSFSTTPEIDPVPAITLKRVDNGEYSRWFIDQARVGDVLHTIGTSGYFTLPPETESVRQLVFFAAGSGITPIYSLIKAALRHRPGVPVVLFYSSRHAANTIFYEPMKALAKSHPNVFTLEFLFSTAPNLLRARLGKSLVETLLKEFVTDYKNTLFYLCGPYEYMRMATIVLQTEGVPAANIRKEHFATVRPNQPRVKDEPPDKEPHRVEVRMGNSTHRFVTQYPETILQRAKHLNIPIPYSCESGQCGTCAATCLQGTVWMSNNEVLLDKEVARGRVLTCTGYPVGGDVVLAFPAGESPLN